MSQFLDIDDSILVKNLLLTDRAQLTAGGGGDANKALGEERINILTPSDRLEQSQCKFIIPQPGLCLKTRELVTNHKIFINLCKADDVPDPEEYFTDEQIYDILKEGSEEEVKDIRIPMSIGEKHLESDNSGKTCPVFDIVINSSFFNQKVLTSETYRTFLMVVIIEAVEEKFKMELEKQDYVILQHKKCIGKLNPQLVKSRPRIKELKGKVTSATSLPLVETTKILSSSNNNRMLVEEIDAKDLQLECCITQVSKDLAEAEIKLPNLKNHKKLLVTLGADRIIVDSPVGQLDIFVPLDIHQEKSKATFSVATGVLKLQLPLVIKP